MAVDVVAKPQAYQTDGQSVAFVVPWEFDNPEDLYVVHHPDGAEPIDLIIDRDYAVVGDIESGVYVDLDGRYGAPEAGGRLIVARRQSARQTIPFNDQVKFPAGSVARMGDRAAWAGQDLDWQVGLSIRLPVTDYPTTRALLPHAAARVQKRLGFDDDGMPALFDADIDLRVRQNGDIIRDGVNDLDFRGGASVIAGDDGRAIITVDGVGGGAGSGGQAVTLLERWLAGRVRELLAEVANLQNTLTQMQYGDWFSRATLRRFVVETEAATRAAYLEAIIAETGPGSALAGRVEIVEGAVNDPSTGLTAVGNAIDLLETSVLNAQGNISVLSTNLSSTQASLTTAENNIAANATTISGHTSQISALDGEVTAVANALISATAATGGSVANARFRAVASSAPSGVDARIGLQVRASSANSFAEAGLFLDALTGGGSRIVLDADKTLIRSGASTVALFDSGGLTVNNLRIGDLDASNFAFNSGVSVGVTSTNVSATHPGPNGQMVNMAGLNGLTRVFDEDGVAIVFVTMSIRNTNSGAFVYGQINNTGPNGSRNVKPTLLWNNNDSGVNLSPIYVSAIKCSSGTHTFNFQWYKDKGSAIAGPRSMLILFFKGATFSGLNGSSSDAGGGSGSGGGNWNINPTSFQ